MASVIKAGNATDGVQVTSDNTGILELKTGTGSGTTAMTVGTGQNVTFAQAANLPNTFGFKNRIINGSMVIDQRNAGASVSVSGASTGYTLDRMFYFMSSAGTATIQRSTTAPSGFTNSLITTVGTADASVGSGDYYEIEQRIEGFNVADLGFGAAGASTVTLSFWVRSSLTGTYCVNLRNNGNNRAYVAEYTISAANTWERKTITIAGDTSGTWTTDNSSGLIVGFCLMVGSTFQQAAGSWGSTSFGFGSSNQVNWMATSSNNFYITGVQLEKGSTATSFDYRPYGTELALCQRYFTRYSNDGSGIAGIGSGFQISTTQSLAIVNFPVQMRSEPTAAISNLQVSDRFTYDADVTLDVIRVGYQSAELTFTNASVGAQYRPCTLFIKSNTSGFLNLSAEL